MGLRTLIGCIALLATSWASCHAANAACSFAPISQDHLVIGKVNRGQELELGAMLKSAPAESETLKVAILQSVVPTQQNVDRFARASIIYSEILTRWSRSTEDFQSATEFVANDLVRNGFIVALVLPLAALVEGSNKTDRRDIASLAVLGLGEVNPQLANQYCESFSLPNVSFEGLSLPISGPLSGLTPNTRLAFDVHALLNTMPPIDRGNETSKGKDSLELLFGRGSFWNHQLASMGGQSISKADVPTRTECHIACNNEAIWPLMGTIVKEFVPSLMKSAADAIEGGKDGRRDGPEPDIVHIVKRAGQDAREKADLVYEETYQKCMDKCPAPEPKPVMRNNQRIDTPKEGTEVSPQTSNDSEDKAKKDKKGDEANKDEQKIASKDDGKNSFGGETKMVPQVAPATEAAPAAAPSLDPNDPRCVKEPSDPLYPKECLGPFANAMGKVHKIFECNGVVEDPFSPRDKWCQSLIATKLDELSPLVAPSTNARLDDRTPNAKSGRGSIGTPETNYSGTSVGLSPAEKFTIKQFLSDPNYGPKLNSERRAILQGMVR